VTPTVCAIKKFSKKPKMLGLRTNCCSGTISLF
jgi:hypothetical protein